MVQRRDSLSTTFPGVTVEANCNSAVTVAVPTTDGTNEGSRMAHMRMPPSPSF